MNFQFPIHYGAFTPCPPAGRGARGGGTCAAAGPNPNCPTGMENGFEKDFAVVWPAPGSATCRAALAARGCRRRT